MTGCLLTAAGRVARTSGLGLQAAGVSTDEHGFIVVDTHQRTACRCFPW